MNWRGRLTQNFFSESGVAVVVTPSICNKMSLFKADMTDPKCAAMPYNFTGDFSAAYKWGGKTRVRPKVGGQKPVFRGKYK